MAEGTKRRSTATTSRNGSSANGGPPHHSGGQRGAPRRRGLMEAATEALMSRIPRADLDERDPDYIREMLPGMWMLASFYFRAEVRGLHNIPADGPVLLVGNHSGGNVTPDTTVFTLAFNTYFGVERRFYQLAHNLVLELVE